VTSLVKVVYGEEKEGEVQNVARTVKCKAVFHMCFSLLGCRERDSIKASLAPCRLASKVGENTIELLQTILSVFHVPSSFKMHSAPPKSYFNDLFA